MTPLELNFDSELRDTILFGTPLDWCDRESATFEQLTVAQLQRLIDERLLDPDDRANQIVAPSDLVTLAHSLEQWHLTCCFEGYVDRPIWEKPVALTGIRVEGWIPKSVRRRFYEQFEAASRLEFTGVMLYARWSWGMCECVVDPEYSLI